MKFEPNRRLGYAALVIMGERPKDHDCLRRRPRCSIVDIALYACTHVAHEGGFDLGRFSAVRAWLQRVAAQPGRIPSRRAKRSNGTPVPCP